MIPVIIYFSLTENTHTTVYTSALTFQNYLYNLHNGHSKATYKRKELRAAGF